MKRKEIYVSISGKHYRFDEHLNFIDYHRGCVISEAANSESSNDYIKYSSMVAAYLGLTSLELFTAKSTSEQLKPIYEACMLINDTPLPGVYPIISINNKFFKLIDFDNLTVQQYTDIDTLFQEENNRVILAAEIAMEIYEAISRPVSKPKQMIHEKALSTLKGVKFGGYPSIEKTKPSDGYLPAMKLSTGYLISILNHYLAYRAQLQEEFSPIFGAPKSNQNPKFMDDTKSLEAWGWYAVLQGVCNNNDKEIDWWMKQPIRMLLKKLVYLKTVKK